MHVRPTDTVASALAAMRAGVPDAANARKHGVAPGTIRRWRRLYLEQGRPRGQTHLTARCPRCDAVPLDGAAYAELLGWYLGDGHVSRGRRDVYALHVINDLSYPVANARIQDLMRAVKPGSRPHTRDRPGSVITTVSWKHWPCLLPQHGPGRKHERPIVLEAWQREVVERHPSDFLRGLLHSDGARVRNWAARVVAGEQRRYDYPRWQFVNASADIRALCCWALDLVGVDWRASGPRTISVSRREAVARLDDLVGPKA
ncbi:helix-turn-helix domain-containing protein [Nocardioides sp. ChNu-99]|uniref:helix-turn-helix domain-containing protein n=1 Tax=Nocardioides sp. ChNu-99 TaxID=2839897 RepID=UPI00240750F7|nr:helix-turn-helix domain-containing protein [Nocardioides sp. ChNu-99]MDF9715619.1 helix-turn-helix domain containing protein [Nocardioides sp. ChNu-99]